MTPQRRLASKEKFPHCSFYHQTAKSAQKSAWRASEMTEQEGRFIVDKIISLLVDGTFCRSHPTSSPAVLLETPAKQAQIPTRGKSQ